MNVWRIALLVVALGVPPADGAEWTSPDGRVTVTEPDPAEFRQVDDPPPPFLVLWISSDEMLRLGVMKAANPSPGKLVRKATEEGLAREVGGTITASSTAVNSGQELWLMTAEGSFQGMGIRLTQAIVPDEEEVYKVMSAKVGDDLGDDEATAAFMDSIQLAPSQPNPPRNAPHDAGQQESDRWDSHNLSEAIGGGAALLLIVAVLWLVVRRGKS